MESHYVSVKFYYKKPGISGNGTSASWNGHVQGNTEAVILAVLQKMHKGYEIVIREIKWRD